MISKSFLEHFMNLAKNIVMLLLWGYKLAVSPMLLPACRYVPSCSEYAMEAVERYGAARGAMMGVWRVLRCHPLAKGGLDPVVRPNSDIPLHKTKFCSY